MSTLLSDINTAPAANLDLGVVPVMQNPIFFSLQLPLQNPLVLPQNVASPIALPPQPLHHAALSVMYEHNVPLISSEIPAVVETGSVPKLSPAAPTTFAPTTGAPASIKSDRNSNFGTMAPSRCVISLVI